MKEFMTASKTRSFVSSLMKMRGLPFSCHDKKSRAMKVDGEEGQHAQLQARIER